MSPSGRCSRRTLSKLVVYSIPSPPPSTGREESAQLCVYVGEEKVVDLWGSPNPSYTPDTLTNVFSRYMVIKNFDTFDML